MRPHRPPSPWAVFGIALFTILLAGCTRNVSRYTLYVTDQHANQAALALTATAQGTPATVLPHPTLLPNDVWEQLATHTAVVQTAVAQGTPAALILTPTRRPTSTPTPTATLFKIPAPPTDWYSNPITGPTLTSLKALGGDDLVKAAIIGLLGALGTFLLFTFKSIVKGIRGLISGLWGLGRRLNKDYVFERAYLDWLIGQYRHLGMLPAQIAARRWQERQQIVDLEKIYTRLSLNPQADDETWIASHASAGRWGKKLNLVSRALKNVFRLMLIAGRFLSALVSPHKLTEASTFNLEDELNRSFPEPAYLPGSLGLIIDRTPRLLIKGDPGSGKTTLMRYLAVTCARALRNDQTEGDSSGLVSERLDWRIKPFPVFVRLSRQGDVVNWGETRSLLNAIIDEMPVDLRRRCPAGFFDRLLARRPCLILLDAYDELGSPSARSVMADYINGFLQVYEKERHRFVVTSRVIGYEGQLDRYGFQNRTVQPLQEGDRSQLIYLRYDAYIAVEKLGRSPAEARSIEESLTRRSDELVQSVEALPRLTQLATNPMLLSLITLVHFLKVELPDERVLLYRDCVEILTERWQRQKRLEAGWKGQSTQDLTLTQKIVLLQELAFAMQQRRDPSGSQALLPKKQAVAIIARALSHLLGDNSQPDPLAHRAEEWVNGIQTDSGIVLEQGLSSDGEPLIGFSHLTFQEYLAAVAVNDNAAYFSELIAQLLNPAWREVVRLYVVLADDATPLIRRLLEHDQQPAGLLLAGWCLTERVRKVDSHLQAQVNQQLMRQFVSSDAELDETSQIFEASLDLQTIAPFLQDQIRNPDPLRQVAATHALRGTLKSPSVLESTRELLASLLDSDFPLETRIAAQEALSVLGDPRFEQLEPMLLPVRAHALSEAPFDILTYAPNSKHIAESLARIKTPWLKAMNRAMYAVSAYLKLALPIVTDKAIEHPNIRLFLHRYYLLWRRWVRRSPNYVDAFEISRYPITNQQYSVFVTEARHYYPYWWPWGIYPKDLASHPVRGITYYDAVKYCQWLSQKTGKRYQLPTEWEWETAAGVLAGREYPWGSEFNADYCNCLESEKGSTTPVGVYLDVKSPFGLQDTSGNVWEFVRPIRWPFLTVATTLALAIELVWIALVRSVGQSNLTGFLWLTAALFFILPGGVGELLSLLGMVVTGKGGSYGSNSRRVCSTYRSSFASSLNFDRKYARTYLYGFRVVCHPRQQ